jgi:hypothetical protein
MPIQWYVLLGLVIGTLWRTTMPIIRSLVSNMEDLFPRLSASVSHYPDPFTSRHPDIFIQCNDKCEHYRQHGIISEACMYQCFDHFVHQFQFLKACEEICTNGMAYDSNPILFGECMFTCVEYKNSKQDNESH